MADDGVLAEPAEREQHTDGGAAHQTDIQCAGEWEGATRVAKRNAELSRKAAAAAKRFNIEGEYSPCLRKQTAPSKTVKILSGLLPKPQAHKPSVLFF